MTSRSLIVAVALICGWVPSAVAQVVTGNMRGTVRSSDDGAPMAEILVTLVHVPSGNEKTTTTNADGAYAFTGLRVGGPYTVTANLDGFLPAQATNIFLSAGKTRDVPLALRLPNEVIEVTGSAVARTSSARTVITSQDIENSPSISRDPRDLVRRSPDVSVEGTSRAMSVQGANPRFNSVTVDGIRQDDDFGINSSGYPTRRSPIALSSIEELAVETSPFDVRYGKFMGGNVNIVTKSGTNDIEGSVIATYSSDALMGSQTKNDELDISFSELRYGAALGGPIVKDRLHFFANGEGLAAATPVDVGPAGSDATNIVSRVSQADLAEVQRIARDVYGFDPGVAARDLAERDLKLFAKLDWAVDEKHRVSGSYQRTAGNAINNTFSSDTSLPLSSNWYDARDTLHTVSLRAFSDWTEELSTEAEASMKLVSSRVPPLNGNGFMQAIVRTADGGQIILGPDEFRHTNRLDNDLLHGKVLANYLLSKHLFTAGVEYDLLRIDNLFIADTNGAAVYGSVAAFEAMTPTSLLYANSTTLNPADGAAKWNAGTITAYVQDQLKITSDLTITGGLRLEAYRADTNIRDNPNFIARYGFANTATLNGRNILMPRIGASYAPTESLNLRAGAGLYSGGTPNVWVSNNYSNDGTRIASVFSMDPALINGFNGRDVPQVIRDMIRAGNGNTDALDPEFKLPSAWKIAGGGEYAFDIPGAGDWGKKLGLQLNYTYTKTFHGVKWIDLRRDLDSLPNNTPVGTTPDGRPLYNTAAMGGFNANRGLDMLLTNDRRGYGHSASIVVEKSFPFGLYVWGTYAYQNVHEANPANSSRSVSNYGLLAVIDPNDPTLAVSNYERKHRITGGVQFSHALIKDLKTTLGIFAETRSGQPYSWTFADSNFGTNLARLFGEDRSIASRNHQLFYVPKGDDSDVTLNNIDPAAFEDFLQQTGLAKYRGRIAPRNAFSSPWISRVDVRFAQDLPHPSGHRARLMVDVENIGNMLRSSWGRASSVPFPFMTPAVDVSYDTATGKYVYSNLRNPSATRVDVLASVWRMSLGVSYDF
jgi:hypothetical protein